MKFMMKHLKIPLAILLILSSELQSMEVKPEQSQCTDCDCYLISQQPVEEEYHYLPLFRVSNREEKFTVLYTWIIIETPNNLIPLLYTHKDFQFDFPTAYAYLKISYLAIKELNSISNGNVPEGTDLDSNIQMRSLVPINPMENISGVLRHGLQLNKVKVLEEGISAVVFEIQLPQVQVLPAPQWIVKMIARPMSLFRETCKCTTKGLKVNVMEDGAFEACETAAFLNLAPFNLETEKGPIPGMKLFMYPKFDFVESFTHIKDIWLIHLTGMVYINNTFLYILPEDIIGLIVKTYFSVIQSQFINNGKMVYQSELKNIENFRNL